MVYDLTRIKGLFRECAADAAYAQELDYRQWLLVWSGPIWADTAPNRLFGSWVKNNGDAT